MKKSSTTAQFRSTEFLTINALADDVARWQAEAMQYRALAQAAIHEVHRLTAERDRARASTQQLHDELRRYTGSACGA